MATVPDRFADIGDPWAGMNDSGRRARPAADARRRTGSSRERAERRGEAHRRRRRLSKPLIEIARTKTKDEALAALDTWRDRHPAVAARLQPADVLVDGMRGPSSIWYRIRINLQHVPEDQRPPQEELIADYSPWEKYGTPPRRAGESPHAGD